MAAVLVTGAAGFIGHAVAMRLLRDGHAVVGIDNFNPYYDPRLKRARWAQLTAHPGFDAVEGDLADSDATAKLFARVRPQRIVHMAAQAGVRFSLENPQAYAASNLNGFLSVLEGARAAGSEHLLYASSSSVYGGNTGTPYSESACTSHPLSLYAATKIANEAMAHAYANLFAIPMTGLRFFTVYGPWGRPDMAPILFARAVLEGKPLQLFNNGDMVRDFTYIDDTVEAVVRTLAKGSAPNPNWDSAHPDPASSNAPWRLFNIGNDEPIPVRRFLAVLEDACGKKAIIENAPMQPGDVPATHADIAALRAHVGFEPATPIEIGVPRLVEWVRDFYAP